ncbi:UNVERIFIED_CONTAM: Cell division cycle protein [Sesamum calycinum]|uniref:Cell division cycle protein n=1 Tax=Sesamum calycinum TaxID=2727403 RepID=A0AAW2RSQ1_9LAMI
MNRCQIQEWYPKFKSCSIKTTIHELPESFVQYLLDDSGPFLLPLSITNDDALPNRVHKPEDEEDFVAVEGSGDEAEEPVPPPSFPELEMEIKASIESLGGAIFPKLNWSAPKDSAWISSTGNLKCTSFSEIALLLRSSDSVIHDLYHAYDSCTDKTASRPSSFFLALRKWYPSLKPEMEFVALYTINSLWGFVNGRIVESRCGIRPGLKTAVPYDYLDTSQGSGWDQFLRNADEELRRQTSAGA